ncbi:hypothetical protein [Rummeliibacillus sp. SL167]|nr:hypothetical protein [Rummeliibacillus sp. SL167]
MLFLIKRIHIYSNRLLLESDLLYKLSEAEFKQYNLKDIKTFNGFYW